MATPHVSTESSSNVLETLRGKHVLITGTPGTQWCRTSAAFTC